MQCVGLTYVTPMFNFVLGPIAGVVAGILIGLFFALLLGVTDEAWTKGFMVLGAVCGAISELLRVFPKGRKRRR